MSQIPTLNRILNGPAKNQSSTTNSALATNKDSLRAVALTQPKQVKRRLAEVALSQLSQHRAWLVSGNWQGDFDCAIWLRTPTGFAQPAQLAVCYRDNQGEKAVFVDRCAAGSYRTVLLNGPVNLTVNGRVRELGLYLIGVDETADMSVEEWHLVARQKR